MRAPKIQAKTFADELCSSSKQHLLHTPEGSDVLKIIAYVPTCANIDVPTPFGPTNTTFGGLLEKVERDQRINGGAVAVLGPVPVKVAE